jgi:ESS family glutamate:Na+ symporter
MGERMSILLSDLETFALGLFALVVATFFVRRFRFLARLNLPPAVIGGVLVAIVVTLLHQHAGTSIEFATRLTNFLLLVFFATLGLSAKFSALKAGGRPLAILCVVTLILLIAQNVAGVLIAVIAGAHPVYGVLVGSVSFVGGPGTAAAWAEEAQKMGLVHAPEVAVAAATLAIVAGALASGPITVWLIQRHKLAGPGGDSAANWVAPDGAVPARAPAPAPSVETLLQVLLLIVVAVLAGDAANAWARAAGFVLPGFLTAMLAGVAITNLGDLVGAKFDFAPIERGGEIALQAFLVMYLMNLRLWTLGAAIGALMANVAVQIVVTALIGVLLLFRWLGRDYDAAVTVGGFLGFGLSSMPVAMATMDGVASRYGPSPKAFLLIALAGSFFVDLANAIIVKAFFALPFLHP